MRRLALISACLWTTFASADHLPGVIKTAKIGGPRSVNANAGDLIRLRTVSTSALMSAQNLKITIEGDAAQFVTVVKQPRFAPAKVDVSTNNGVNVDIQAEDKEDVSDDKDNASDAGDKAAKKSQKRRPLIGSVFLDGYLVAKSEGTAKVTIVILDRAGKPMGDPHTLNVNVATHAETPAEQ